MSKSKSSQATYQEMQAARKADTSSNAEKANPAHKFRAMHLGIWKCDRCGFQATGTDAGPFPDYTKAACFVALLAEPVKTP